MFMHPIVAFLNDTTSRVPMTDWYDTLSARQIHFQARSVVGGVYIKMLSDPQLSAKWAQSSTVWQQPDAHLAAVQ